MLIRKVCDWIVSTLDSCFGSIQFGGRKRVAIRVRRDGKTELKPTVDEASIRSGLMLFIGVLSIVAILFSLRGRATKVGQVATTPTVVVC